MLDVTTFVPRAAEQARQATFSAHGAAEELAQGRDHFVCGLYTRRCGNDAQDAPASIRLAARRIQCRKLFSEKPVNNGAVLLRRAGADVQAPPG
jgi:hypothetical protein